MIIAFSGHRPNKLDGYDPGNQTRTMIRMALMQLIENIETKNVTFISGMAQGFDQDAAWCIVHYRNNFYPDFKLHAYLPCEGQDYLWPTIAKQSYHSLLEQANEVVLVNKGTYASWKMLARNKAMVDKCDLLIACWNGEEKGGTWHTINYAQSINKSVLTIKV